MRQFFFNAYNISQETSNLLKTQTYSNKNHILKTSSPPPLFPATTDVTVVLGSVSQSLLSEATQAGSEDLSLNLKQYPELEQTSHLAAWPTPFALAVQEWKWWSLVTDQEKQTCFLPLPRKNLNDFFL